MKKQSISLFFLSFALTIQANPTHSWFGQAKSYFSSFIGLFDHAKCPIYTTREDLIKRNLELYAPTIVTSHHWIKDHQDSLLSEEIADAHNRYDALAQDDDTLSEYASRLQNELTLNAANLSSLYDKKRNESAAIRPLLNHLYNSTTEDFAKALNLECYLQELDDNVKNLKHQRAVLSEEYARASSLQLSWIESRVKVLSDISETRRELNTLFSKKDINLPDELKNVETIASYNTRKKSHATAPVSRLKRKLNVGDAIL